MLVKKDAVSDADIPVLRVQHMELGNVQLLGGDCG